MFRSVFAKYVLAFMLIILISFLIILSTITSIIGNYSRDTKEDIMENSSKLCSAYLGNKLNNTGINDIAALSAIYRGDIEDMFSIIALGNDDLTILLTDTSGRIILAVGRDASDIEHGAAIPKVYADRANQGGGNFRLGKDEGVFSSPHMVHSMPVIDEADGVVRANIFVCTSSLMMAELIETISKTIMMAILWVLMAALIAVYFITERIVGPLKKISVAARQFADGKFDARVPVHGKDEVAELAVAFNNMAESLDNYETMRNTFISNVSHDLRTPMTSISGFVDGILDGVIPPEKHEYYLRIVSNEAQRLSRLVSSLLDLSKIQAGERKFTMSPFDICEMARQILISFEQNIESKHLEVEFDCEEDKLLAVADRDAIYQIMYNLCDNAVKFSIEGGLLRIKIKKIKNKKILVSVYNEGQGISPVDLPYVFERFYKSDKSRGLNKTGVGLGLYISKTIIDAHGEKIWVESEFERNCTFSFTLSLE